MPRRFAIEGRFSYLLVEVSFDSFRLTVFCMAIGTAAIWNAERRIFQTIGLLSDEVQ
jgi:hypothetical protein